MPTNTTDSAMPENGDPKLIAPNQCPVCGAKVSGGGEYQVYYVCGGHMWIEKSPAGGYVIKGHCSNDNWKPIQSNIKEQNKQGNQVSPCKPESFPCKICAVTEMAIKDILTLVKDEVMKCKLEISEVYIINNLVEISNITQKQVEEFLCLFNRILKQKLTKLFEEEKT